MVLTVATCIGAIASLLTAGILVWTLKVARDNLKVAWNSLAEFKSSERVRRTTDLFFNFYAQEYMLENQIVGGPPLKCTPYMAIGNVIRDPAIVPSALLMVAHNYFEAIAALHWKGLIDSELYFDSFAVVVVRVYEPLAQRLTAQGEPLTPYSRIPSLYSDAMAYLEKRKHAAAAN